MARYIRYKYEKQQINFLNCGELDRWIDTCHKRVLDFVDVCDSFCGCGSTEIEPYNSYLVENPKLYE